ncbi:cell division protein FtsK [Streptacidiphilus sp. ASG 303]|uniref:FtsK/SpoIIIE domain-containing protein n=1 Tax=Streptacidiphilus sp. ASG 303 TaxID=2896847 RepID=UPI001E477227|nr:FtsK/SpoIIIE domain-containing protein [Streptacidiphilus sp. ASG 303]MCD0482134.1 cell division protein FtsK [Streptacidiphilus sp. ASG 303]
MGRQFLWWLLLALALGLLLAAPKLRRRFPHMGWYLVGFPATVGRLLVTWRRLTTLCDLAVSRRPGLTRFGQLVVKGQALRPVPPRLGIPRLRRGGLVVPVRMHPGQVPDQYTAAAEAITHAWKVHAVRVTSDARGRVLLSAVGADPLTSPAAARDPGRLLAAVVGAREDGAPWLVDLRRVPHWLVTGATRSGKSTLIAALVRTWAPQRLALVGIDLKGGMELAPFQPRLSALATTRTEAAELLGRLVEVTATRMLICRTHGARSVWELDDKIRPVPVVVIVDEVAELFLSSGSREDKAEIIQTVTALIRLAQLGAALGVHLVIAGQRVGSDLGPGVTALRAQLAGRVCHRVNDQETAVMTLGDLNKDALAAAQQITPAEQGVAIVAGDDGAWMRARSALVTPAQARAAAEQWAHLTPALDDLEEPGVYA